MINFLSVIIMCSINRIAVACDIEDLCTESVLADEEEMSKQSNDLNYNPYFKHPAKFQKELNRIDLPDKIIEPMRRSVDRGKLRQFMITLMDRCLQSEHIDERTFKENLLKTQRLHKIVFTKPDLWYQYNVWCRESGIVYDDFYRTVLQSKQIRSQAGVMIYTVFTPPDWRESRTGEMKSFSCAHDCSYCPEQPGRPRSYIDGEPGLDRGHAVNYDVVKQIHARANTYRATGHINDKAEVLVLGGTWHSYPKEFRIQFIADVYHAFNTIHDNRGRPKLSMEEEIQMNRCSKCHVIGLTIETRPDMITPQSLILMRSMGCTRVQLGIQHTDDRVLRRIRRNCTSAQSILAIKLLKDFCFKVDIHLMPDLPKPYTESFEKDNHLMLNSKKLVVGKESIDWNYDMVDADKRMFDMVINHPDWQADQWKIYPCTIVPWTKLKDEYDKGLHIPYGSDASDGPKINPTSQLIQLLISVMSRVNPWVRVNRVIRDIPEDYIFGGIKNMGARQLIENEMKRLGLVSSCKRYREIRRTKINQDDVHQDLYKYDASGGVEYDLQFNTNTNQLVGFLRLRFTDNAGAVVDRNGKKKVYMENLYGCALIRELHVYGEAVAVNREIKNNKCVSQQHNGYGTLLINRACQLAVDNGYKKIAVISGEGVRNYYSRFGFVDSDGVDRTMIKDLTEWNNQPINLSVPTNNINWVCIDIAYNVSMIILCIGFIMYFFQAM